MGLLSISAIVISLTCLAVLMGLRLALIFQWPHKAQDDPDSQPDSTPSDKE
jgi:hypothetical protein